MTDQEARVDPPRALDLDAGDERAPPRPHLQLDLGEVAIAIDDHVAVEIGPRVPQRLQALAHLALLVEVTIVIEDLPLAQVEVANRPARVVAYLVQPLDGDAV